MRKVLIGLGVLVALLAVALVALVMLVDVNRFKPQIEQAVKDQFNRSLRIDGDLSLSVFPRIGVSLPKTTLSEHASDKPFATLDGARVSVALLPLLSGRIEAGKVSVFGLNATIEKRADGSTNLDDLIKGKDSKPDSGAPKASGGPAQFEIGGVELANATLTYRDLQAKNTVTLSRLNLNAGRIATQSRTPLTIDTAFASTQPAASGELKAKGTAEIDLVKNLFGAEDLDATVKATVDKQPIEATVRAGRLSYDVAGGAVGASKLNVVAKGSFGTTQIDEARLDAPELAYNPIKKLLSVGGLQASARGKLGNDTFESSLAAPKIDITEAQAQGERITASVKLSGTQTADARLTLEGVTGSAKDMKIGKLQIAANAQQGTRRIVAAVGSPATASLETQTFALPQLAGDITVEDPAIPQKTVKMPITGAFSADGKNQRVDLRFTTKFDETTLSAEADVRNFSAPRIGFEASADKLNLDRYFPPPKPVPGNDSGDPKADPPVDLSALKSLNLNGEARVGQLQARNVKLSNLRVVLKAANGRLDVAPLTASLYGGSINASAAAIADGNRISAGAALTGVSIQPLMKDAIDKDLLEGKGNVKLDVSTAGPTVGALMKGLDGGGAIALRDGAIKGINIAQSLRNAKSMLSGGGTESKQGSVAEKTDFSELNASFKIDNGVASSNDLELKSPLLRVGGAGTVNIPAGTLDYTVKASVVSTLKGQDGRDINELRGVTVPIKLSGPFEKLSYHIAWGEVGREALKSRVTEQLKERLGAKPDTKDPNKPADAAPTPKTPQDRAKDALKGLLGR